ncbi:SPX domain-containing protein [Geranomyces variabilis]|nr:SPX domain-containing protein [Geranomyces variabilis]KAJ3139610.1 low-affinity phosphate transporter [Geranomyces variabilis]
MKFSHSIQLNASPEWQANYLAYSQLKKILYAIERAMLGVERLPASPRDIEADGEGDGETSPLLEPHSPLVSKLTPDEANAFFVRALDEQLEKISSFYAKKERLIADEVHSFVSDVSALEDSQGMAWDVESGLHQEPQASSSQVAIEEPTLPSQRQHNGVPSAGTWPRRQSSMPVEANRRTSGDFSSRLWASKAMKGNRTRYSKRATDLFILLSELKDYVELNYTGFSKIIKKYDKVTGSKLRRQYMATKVDLAQPFRPNTKEAINNLIEEVVRIYATIRTDGKIGIALTDLKGLLRERVIWERNTIWKDMIEQERKRETIGLRGKTADRTALDVKTKISLFGHTLVIPPIPWDLVKIALCIGPFLFLLLYPTFEALEQRYCLAILVFASLLWALEVLPLFTTAIMIPLLIVMLRVLRAPDVFPDGTVSYHRLTAKEAAKKIFSDMFGPVIMLLLGGFSLAAALSKHNIAKGVASFVLGKAGSKPQWVLLANMFVSTFASMWISNVAAPVLCFSLITPILRNLPSRSSYGRCLIMGIAMASNVGGMASPISSPQNIIAIGTMDPPPTWPQFFAVSLPLVITMNLLIWAVLLLIYRPSASAGAAPPELFGHSSYFADHPLDRKQWFIIGVSFLTIILWCAESALEAYVGDMGVIAIVPIVAFYGMGLLNKDDWNSMLWTVVMLAMGGTALGKAVDSSGLLLEITQMLTPHLAGMSPFKCLALFSGLVLVGTTFISHTVGALIILPIILKVGLSLPDPRANTLVMAAAFMTSGAMSLPVSSFPNMNAISLEDSTGVPWVDVADFIKVGIPCSMIAWSVVMTIGYPIMGLVGIQ